MARIAKHLQGDMSMYTHDALKKRMGLRRHPGITAAIERWWGAMPKSNLVRASRELERVDYAGYLELNVNIQVLAMASSSTSACIRCSACLAGRAV